MKGCIDTISDRTLLLLPFDHNQSAGLKLKDIYKKKYNKKGKEKYQGQ